MARQAGPTYIIGTIDDLVFYKLGDTYYVRQKGKPTSGIKKKLKDPKHYPVHNLRKQEFGRASTLASDVYRPLPRKQKVHGLHGKLTGKAVRLLRQGVSEEAIKTQLRKEFLPATSIEKEKAPEVNPGVVVKKRVRKEKKSSKGLSKWRVADKGLLVKENTKEAPQEKPVQKKSIQQSYWNSAPYPAWSFLQTSWSTIYTSKKNEELTG